MSTRSHEGLESWILGEWTKRFAQAIESMTGETPVSEFMESTLSAEPDTLWWEQSFNLPGAIVWIGAAGSQWKEIGDRVLKAAGVDDGDEESVKSTYQELVNQSLSGLGQSITNRLRREVTCDSGREATPGLGKTTFSVRVGFAGQSFVLTVALSQELAGLLAPEEPAKPEAKKAAAPAEPPSLAGTAPGKSLDLLLDVELPIGVSFGRAQLPLKEVIKLTTGSIVELNRAVSEPVEIIVNNCVIARGQVVVVEGNFGVRIQQVISRQERIRTLK